MRLSPGRLLARLFPMTKFKESCVKVHEFVDFHVKKATAAGIKKDKAQAGVDVLLAQTEDRTLIRAMAFWKELREEVLKYGDDLFVFDALRSNETIQNILTESLRLRPIFSAIDRIALRDTALPTGGGPDSASPILVKSGTIVSAAFYNLHREPSVYVPDIEAFSPHCWKTIKPSQWQFTPFGVGPRNCMGREKSLVEAAYLLAKLAGGFETLETRDERLWIGKITMTCANNTSRASLIMIALTQAAGRNNDTFASGYASLCHTENIFVYRAPSCRQAYMQPAPAPRPGTVHLHVDAVLHYHWLYKSKKAGNGGGARESGVKPPFFESSAGEARGQRGVMCLRCS
ncbi:cytochrome P450 [Bimuria novae-zelandiae CBS 107.79]|uniref:Cytochrome P450 n=1 Tax=Bimuria novae-zelandiae CBS 107.79 TaxID=1447943 RepID=A0A6A5VK02_9PLEO|nr:cytochrome P450 [Bimuria novae-zelandiae CBS 107.79]